MIQPAFHALLATILFAWNRLVPPLENTPAARRWWRRAWGIAGVVVVLLGVGVERRLAFQSRRMGDVGVFLRAGWAVRAGEDLYRIVDDNGWHYHYPPLFAILMSPLADPPPGVRNTVSLPYAVSVGVWSGVSLLSLGLGVTLLARVLLPAAAGTHERLLTRRKRVILAGAATLACFPPIGLTLFTGQVNLVLLFLLCGMVAATLRGRRGEAGLWLAGAISLKVIPAFLLVYPLWRRDARCLLGCGAGLVLGLVVVPATVFGPARALRYAAEWAEVLVLPGLGLGDDQSRARELINVTATDSQSLLTVCHNLLHVDRAVRPSRAAPALRLAVLGLGGLMTTITLVAAGWRRPRSPAKETLFVGALILVMLFLSPVCHRHYFCLSLPLVMGLLGSQQAWNDAAVLDPTLRRLLAGNLLANALPLVDGLDRLGDLGLPLAAALVLWGRAVTLLWGRDAEAAACPPGMAPGRFMPPGACDGPAQPGCHPC